MTNFAVWDNEGPPKGTVANYPLKPTHKAQASIAAFPGAAGDRGARSTTRPR